MTTVERLESGWLADTPVNDSLLRRFLFNQSDLQEAVARACGGRAERTPDVSLADTGLPVAYVNEATLLRPLTGDDDPVLDDIATFYGHGSPGLLLSPWPTPDLSRRGWMPVGHPMFVARGLVPTASYDAPLRPGVSVRVAETAEDLALVERITAEGYPIPEMLGMPPNSMIGADLVNSAVVYRIGCLDGEPVTVAASQVAHGVVNLCLAATLPQARRRGVWQALVDARLADAPELPAVSFTSDYSRPGFVHMGFLPVSRFTLWVVI